MNADNSRKSKSRRRTRKNSVQDKHKVKHAELVNPKQDMEDCNYESECNVKVITPISFDDAVVTTSKKQEAPKKDDKKILGKLKSNEHVVNTHKPDKSIEVVISLGSKKGHPWESRIDGSLAYVANRVPGGTLEIKRGENYRLKFIGRENSGHELILTRDPVGGKGASLLEGTNPIPAGKEGIFVMTKDCPSVIYYQDRHKEFFGGMISVK